MMNRFAVALSLIALASIITCCLLYLSGTIELSAVKTIVLLATIVWFAATPIWMDRKLPPDADQVEI